VGYYCCGGGHGEGGKEADGLRSIRDG
jgi:hypothetical protein